MIELPRSTPKAAPAIQFIGLGGAGGNVLDRLVLDGLDAKRAVAMNTDGQALNGSVAQLKVHLGKNTTRGLGAGGDPELGYAAAEEAADEIAAAVAGAEMVFVCAGLGGGTGSGAAPLVAHLARKAGALVVAFVTLPFAFEGKRRSLQAAEALGQIEAQADLVVCFENDRMGEAAAPAAGIQQAFVAADQTLSSAMRTIATAVQKPGLLGLGLDDLASLLRGRNARCFFGAGESDGPNRTHEALERALRCPLMNRGKSLADARSVLIHVTGGAELALGEVTALMEAFNRHVGDDTLIHFGVATDAELGRRICVAILSSDAAAAPAGRGLPDAPRRAEKPARTGPAGRPEEAHVPNAPDGDEEMRDDEEKEFAGFEETTTPVAPAQPAKQVPKYAPQPAPAKKEERAEQMPLEPANRGRFEKSEPTIVDGEDLDVPTFLRKNTKLK